MTNEVQYHRLFQSEGNGAGESHLEPKRNLHQSREYSERVGTALRKATFMKVSASITLQSSTVAFGGAFKFFDFSFRENDFGHNGCVCYHLWLNNNFKKIFARSSDCLSLPLSPKLWVTSWYVGVVAIEVKSRCWAEFTDSLTHYCETFLRFQSQLRKRFRPICPICRYSFARIQLWHQGLSCRHFNQH